RKARDVVAGEDDAAAVGSQLAGELGDQRRLAGAVGADQRVHLAGTHLQVDAGAGDHTAEALGQPLHVEQRRVAVQRRHARSSAPARPRRAKRTTISSIQPVQNAQYVVYDASVSSATTSTAAPRTPPQIEATPPRITITISVPECVH